MTLVVDELKLAELAQVALVNTTREYPHKLDQELNSDADVRPPREVTPSFYGCYDWHSAVHSHWLLVRALARGLPSELQQPVRELLDDHLGPERLAGEFAFLSGLGGQTTGRPYGWAWLLQLHAECELGQDPSFKRWAAALEPLAELLRTRLLEYFRTVAFPLRNGTHGNTAFSLDLSLRAARALRDRTTEQELEQLVARCVGDGAGHWGDDPAGDAFLTPPLVEAALMADVLEPQALADWLDNTLTDRRDAAWDPPQFALDGSDPGTVHLEGLLVSRAWCLDRLARRLPADHPASALAGAAADAHVQRAAELQPADGFLRSHWLPTYLLYLDECLRDK
jgi:Protein of unknown function (DUF2891)